jgi:excisionase family DNA binding protein
VTGQLLTPKQLAERLNVPESWIYAHVRQGVLPCVRLGRYVRFTEDMADLIVSQNERRRR